MKLRYEKVVVIEAEVPAQLPDISLMGELQSLLWCQVLPDNSFQVLGRMHSLLYFALLATHLLYKIV